MASSVENSAEKCRVDRRILDAIMQQPMTANWKRSGNYYPYVLVKLVPDTREYNSIAWQFHVSSRFQLTVTKIQRVENPFLLGQYLMKKEKMRNMGLSVQEKTLYHGTSLSEIDRICRHNFDWRRCGTLLRDYKYGRGVSFAFKANYDRHYTYGHIKVMFLTKVLVGRISTNGNLLTWVPPDGFDTTADNKRSVYVKYEDDDFYPEYVIYYTRCYRYSTSPLENLLML